MEFERAYQNPNPSLATSIWLLTPKYRMQGLTDISIVIYVWNSNQNNEFERIRSGPPKSESDAGVFYLAPDAKVSYDRVSDCGPISQTSVKKIDKYQFLMKFPKHGVKLLQNKWAIFPHPKSFIGLLKT